MKTTDEQDSNIEALLRVVGPRDLPPPAVQEAVRAAVHAEWRAMVDARIDASVRRKRAVITSIAAGVSVLAVGVAALLMRAPSASPVQVAAIVKIERTSPTAHVQIKDADESSWRDVVEGTVVHADSVLRTDGATRVALALSDVSLRGVSLRVDGATVIHVGADRARLDHGRVYVDSGVAESSAAGHFTVDTSFGAVSHLGTQYQVQLTDAELAVSVREGRVAIAAQHSNSSAITVGANEFVRINSAGEVSRQAVAAHDAMWQWTALVAPSFDIENRSLAEFLQWAARETGTQLQYGSNDLRAQAEQIVLHGSVNGLTPEQALKAVAATTAVNIDLDGQDLNVLR